MTRLFGGLFRALLLAAGIGVALCGLASLLVMDRLYAGANDFAFGEAARALAAALPPRVAALLGDPGRAGPDAAAEAAGWSAAVSAASGFRLTLVARDGRVVADSAVEPSAMENHGERIEVAAALEGRLGFARRRSDTVGMELFYAAAPLLRAGGGEVYGALRLARDLPTLEARLTGPRWALLAAAAGAAAASALVALFLSRSLARPLTRLASRAAELRAGWQGGESGGTEAGDAARGEPGVPEEIHTLGGALEAMAAELAERLREARAAERERGAILEGMAEALLSLDSGLRIRFANGAARARFDLPEAGPAEAGRLPGLLEATRSTALQEAAEACLASGKPLETEFAHYRNGEETWLRLVASPIAAGEGLVLVLEDRTRLRRLERVRRDFVANVSHELRTPIQLVKGFAESLRDGGLEDPGQAARFVSIIQRNANRMESLVEDLLVLARLEQEGGGRLPLEEVVVRDLVREALDAVAPRAEAAGVELSSDVEEGLAARANGGLLVQALVNLLDNAVKYSPAGSPVLASARREGGRLVLEVRDRGTGIPAADLPRLFERFYRVDRGRSRELGGTGLGLAIVRHIALAHGGEVAVESWEGEGSLFRLSLPADGLPGAD